MKQVDISLSGIYRLVGGEVRKSALPVTFQESITSALSPGSFLNRKQFKTFLDSFVSTSWLWRVEGYRLVD